MSLYNKPYLTFDQQLNLLKSRGMEVTNEKIALEYLRRLGYYRLSGYWYPCRQLCKPSNIQHKQSRLMRLDNFMTGTKFEDIVNLYVFDKKLRLIVLDAIERIEVAVRVEIAYLLGKTDPFAYNNQTLLHGNFTKKFNKLSGKSKHQEWLSKHDELINRSKEDFAIHYKSQYGLPLPIWVAIELWDFGLLSTFYQGMRVHDKDFISKKYGINNWQIMESWLRTLNYVRNVVAHHSRLWNRNLIDQPKLPKLGDMGAFDHLIGNTHMTSRVYVVLCILSYLLKSICPKSSWYIRVSSLVDSFPNTPHFRIKDMG
ncbi:Abi family protein [Legionella jordanis]|nr:Abi family protein [Legionella jordanis]RMX14875.1 Abi family protein [Legionella jordanis]